MDNAQTEYDNLVVTREYIKDIYSDRHPSVLAVLQFFANAHLSSELQNITRHCVKMAFVMVDNIKDSSELTDGLRSLLRAKDSFARAYLLMKDK